MRSLILMNEEWSGVLELVPVGASHYDREHGCRHFRGYERSISGFLGVV